MIFRLNFSPRYVSLGAGRRPQLRGHISRRGGAIPQHRIALLAHKPHPSSDDALSGAGYAWVKFYQVDEYKTVFLAI